MKPNFALNLTHDSIGLLHRTSRGWLEVGTAALDAPDLGEALGYLRKSALGLSPTGFNTKLIIPNSQILYEEVEAPGPTDAKRRNQIKKALEGRTPYEVSDLVFDWCGDGPHVQVAVVARETLEEAEQFAVQHRFSPVSFVAIPEKGDFTGEPFFGRTAGADELLGKSTKVERDPDAVVIIAGDLPSAEASAPVEPGPDAPKPGIMAETQPEIAATPADAAPDAEPLVEEVPADAEPEPQTAAPVSDEMADPAELSAPHPVVDAPNDTVTASGIIDPVATEDSAAQPEKTDAEDETATDDALTRASIAEDAVSPPAQITGITDNSVAAEDDAPVALDVETVLDDDVPPAPTFTTRRQGAAIPPPPPLGKAMPSGQVVGLTTAAKGKAKPDLPPNKPDVSAVVQRLAKGAAGPVTAPGIPGLGPERRAKVIASVSDPRANFAPRGKTAAPGALGSRPLPVKGKPRFLGLILTGVLLLLLALVAAFSSYYLTSAEQDGETAVASSSASGPDTASAEMIEAPVSINDEILADAQDPAEFAAVESPDLPLNVDVAAESDAMTAAEPVEPAIAEPAAVEVPEPPATPEVPDVTVAAETPATDTAPPATAPEETVSAEPLVPEPETPVVAEPEAPAVSSDPAPAAETVTAQAPAPSADEQDEIFLSTMDAPPAVQEIAALPRIELSVDAPPDAQLPPPPFGTQYQFDAAGLIVPTPEGIVTPEGVTLIAGAPPSKPPTRPASVEAAAAPIAAPAAQPATVTPTATPDPSALYLGVPEAVATETPPQIAPVVADPALAGQKPRARPEGLAPQADQDDAAAPLPVDTRLAGSRPRLRPEAIVALGEAARAAAEAATLAAGPVSPLAVAISGRPAARPGNFSKAVEAAVAAAVREAPPAPVEVAAAPPPPVEEPQQQATLRVRKPTPADEPTVISAPEADDEPDADTRGPRTAPTGSVAKRATLVNAINLSKINLIGVYGTSSARYALIRQSNGRYKKVQVGDRVEGGVVAAITANEVRYQKSGRMYELSLPNG